VPNNEPLNLIRVFDFYLALMALVSFVRRWDVYWNALYVLVAVRGRWPKLLARLAEHQELLMNWTFFRPAVLAVFLTAVQLICSRLLWPQAVLTGPELRRDWWWLALVIVALVPMLAVDTYFIVRVGRFDRNETAKYLDQAESWLGWKGPLVRVLTLGVVNPRRIVDEEVKKSLAEIGTTVRASLWWVSVQIGLRVVFGLTLWTVWALH
jgi:hypothetical protein